MYVCTYIVLGSTAGSQHAINMSRRVIRVPCSAPAVHVRWVMRRRCNPLLTPGKPAKTTLTVGRAVIDFESRLEL